MGRNRPLSPAPGLLAEIKAALVERQTLVAGPDTPAAQARIDALGQQLAELLEQLAKLHPPAALELDDEASVPGEFYRFLDRSGAKQCAD